jgi:dihydrodipicolinate synthase/N-acetylneuraminate lyase
MRLNAPAIVPAMLTPYDADGEVDHAALRAHGQWLIERGVDGLMPCGSTGETALLSDDEVVEAVTTVVAAADGRVPVIAHVGRPATRTTIELARRALDAGADTISAVVPYYHPLEPDQVLDHYRALMDELGAERVLAYCIPSHSNNELDADGLRTLAAEGLAGFKDSTMSAERHDAYAAAIEDSGRDDFALLVGAGSLVLRSLRAGSAGAVLGVANLHPELCGRLRDAFRDGDDAGAEVLQAELARAEEAAMPFSVLKREVAERMRSEAALDYNPALRAPFGTAGRPLTHPA